MADQNNPWDTTPAADSAAQSADAWGTPAAAPTDGGGADWLTSTPAPNVEHFNILDPFHKTGNGRDRLGRYPFPPPLPGCARSGGLYPQRFPATAAGDARACGNYRFRPDSLADFRCRNGRGDAGFTDCYRRDRRMVAGNGDFGAGVNRPAILYCHRFAAGDLAGKKPTGSKNHPSTA